jgi:hypothetical protein
MMQLDPVNPPPPTPGNPIAALWDWTANVSAALSLIDTKAGVKVYDPYLNQAYPFWIRQVRQWTTFNAAQKSKGLAQVPAPSETLFLYTGDGTAGHPFVATSTKVCSFAAPTDAQGQAKEVTGQPNTYWYADAIAMKYNLGGLAYMTWNGTGWLPHRSQPNQNGAQNITYEFCTCASTATCQHATPPAYY